MKPGCEVCGGELPPRAREEADPYCSAGCARSAHGVPSTSDPGPTRLGRPRKYHHKKYVPKPKEALDA